MLPKVEEGTAIFGAFTLRNGLHVCFVLARLLNLYEDLFYRVKRIDSLAVE